MTPCKPVRRDEPDPIDPTDPLAAHAEWLHDAALRAVAAQLGQAAPERPRAAGSPPPAGPRLVQLARRLDLDDALASFLWAAAACASDPRLAAHGEALAGPLARRGLSVATYARLVGLSPAAGRSLAARLAGDNPLRACGLLVAGDDDAPAALRPYAAAPALLGWLCAGGDGADVADVGDVALDPPLTRLVAPTRPLVLDDASAARSRRSRARSPATRRWSSSARPAPGDAPRSPAPPVARWSCSTPRRWRPASSAARSSRCAARSRSAPARP